MGIKKHGGKGNWVANGVRKAKTRGYVLGKKGVVPYGKGYRHLTEGGLGDQLKDSSNGVGRPSEA